MGFAPTIPTSPLFWIFAWSPATSFILPKLCTWGIQLGSTAGMFLNIVACPTVLKLVAQVHGLKPSPAHHHAGRGSLTHVPQPLHELSVPFPSWPLQCSCWNRCQYTIGMRAVMCTPPCTMILGGKRPAVAPLHRHIHCAGSVRVPLNGGRAAGSPQRG